jgi:hypothetical protein
VALRLVGCALLAVAVYVPATAWRSRLVIEELTDLYHRRRGPAAVRVDGI